MVIVGGGMVGASLAHALGRASLPVTLIEAVAPSVAGQPSYDDRPIALSYGSWLIFNGLGLGQELRAQAAPIRTVHVSQQGRFGVTRLSASEYGVEALGFVIPARTLGTVVNRSLTQCAGEINYLCPARVASVDEGEDLIRVKVNHAGTVKELRTRLLVVADGGSSPTRDMLRISVQASDYGQTAITANVTPGSGHRDTAYERFTPAGPLALLPLKDNRCGLIWSVPTREAQAFMAMEDARFLRLLNRRFGARLGEFERVGKRSKYPLTLIRSRRQVRRRVALVGNAAHTLHPIAGQGFNLALRDVAALAQLIVDAVRAGHDPGQGELLHTYYRWRQGDQRSVTAFTDGLVKLFGSDFAPLAAARGAGLLALDLFPPLRRVLARQAMGLSGRQTRVARGLPL